MEPLLWGPWSRPGEDVGTTALGGDLCVTNSSGTPSPAGGPGPVYLPSLSPPVSRRQTAGPLPSAQGLGSQNTLLDPGLISPLTLPLLIGKRSTGMNWCRPGRPGHSRCRLLSADSLGAGPFLPDAHHQGSPSRFVPSDASALAMTSTSSRQPGPLCGLSLPQHRRAATPSLAGFSIPKAEFRVSPIHKTPTNNELHAAGFAPSFHSYNAGFQS